MNLLLLENLPRRAAVLRALRQTLDAAEFIEVETPVRIVAPANEPHIRPPASGGAFLRASPELQMKRLLAAGFQRIYQIGPCFREGERGDRHAPEFSMLEWYRSPGDWMEVLDDCVSLVRAAILAAKGDLICSIGGTAIDFSRPVEQITVRSAFIKWAGWDPLEKWDEERFDSDMALLVEPSLPRDRLVALTSYPAQAASLARLSPDDSRVAERWEVYAGGIELANAFGELTDPLEQRRRFEEARAAKIAAGETPMPLDEEFLSALASIQSAAGVALGVDRLVMVALEAARIDDVRAFLPNPGELY